MLLAIPAMEKSVNTLPEDIRLRNLDVVMGWQAVLSFAAGGHPYNVWPELIIQLLDERVDESIDLSTCRL